MARFVFAATSLLLAALLLHAGTPTLAARSLKGELASGEDGPQRLRLPADMAPVYTFLVSETLLLNQSADCHPALGLELPYSLFDAIAFFRQFGYCSMMPDEQFERMSYTLGYAASKTMQSVLMDNDVQFDVLPAACGVDLRMAVEDAVDALREAWAGQPLCAEVSSDDMVEIDLTERAPPADDATAAAPTSEVLPADETLAVGVAGRR